MDMIVLHGMKSDMSDGMASQSFSLYCSCQYDTYDNLRRLRNAAQLDSGMRNSKSEDKDTVNTDIVNMSGLYDTRAPSDIALCKHQAYLLHQFSTPFEFLQTLIVDVN